MIIHITSIQRQLPLPEATIAYAMIRTALKALTFVSVGPVMIASPVAAKKPWPPALYSAAGAALAPIS